MFHDTHLPLWKWFLAVYLIVASKKGISANQLKRTLNITYKTAWYLCHRIRAAFIEVDAQLLKGIVEADETFVGGEVRGMGRGYTGNKAIVVGAIQRDGAIRLQVVGTRDRETLHGFIRENVAGDTQAIYTDDSGRRRHWSIQDVCIGRLGSLAGRRVLGPDRDRILLPSPRLSPALPGRNSIKWNAR